MAETHSYCKYVRDLNKDDVHRKYHDTEYGFPIENDNELFGRLLLEINQAGLSWTTILNKKENFRKAYSDFDIRKIAKYKEADIKRLMNDAGIIRNRLKIQAAIHNACQIMEMQKAFGSFREWLDHHHPLTKKEWVRLFKKNFKFTGGEITNEFLLSTGYLEGAHGRDCPVYDMVITRSPPWSRNSG